MHAIILAGGKGTRLLPHTADLPKALIELGGRQLLDVLVDQLASAGAKRITLCVAHLAGQIEAHLGNGERFGVRVDYTHEPEPFGTAGPLRLVERWDTPALVVNADVLTTVDFADMHRRHCDSGAEFTVASFQHRVTVPFGVLEISGGQVGDIREKPDICVNVAAGIYVVDPDLRRHLPPTGPASMPQFVAASSAAGRSVAAYPFWGEWHDIGDPARYESARQRFQTNPFLFAPHRIGARHREGDAMADVTEQQFTEIIACEMGAVLMAPPPGPLDDFFELGGDSLRAVELITRLVARRHPGDGTAADHLRNALLLAIFDDPTPAALARVIQEEA